MPHSPLPAPRPSPLKILIRLPNWLGDVVMSTAFIDAVAAAYPGAEIDVVIKKDLSSIAGLIPGLNMVYPFAKKEFKGLLGAYRFGKMLRGQKYDLYFNLPTSLSSSVMAFASRAKKRIGFSKEGSFFLMTNSFLKPVEFHRVDEYVSLLEQYTKKPIGERKVCLVAAHPAKAETKTVLVNFNSEAESRKMPLDKGQALLTTLTKTYPDVTFTLVGSPKEAAFVGELIAGLSDTSHVKNMAGKTDLAGLCNLMAGCTVILTTDSGPAHLANAIGAPTIVLFGAGNENNTAPYNKHNLTVLRANKLSCEPCVKNTCELYGIPKCMELLDELTIITPLGLYLRHA